MSVEQSIKDTQSKTLNSKLKKRKTKGFKIVLTALIVSIMCAVVGMLVYLGYATKYDHLWLNLSTLETRDTTFLYAQDESGAWQEIASLQTNLQKTWVDIEDTPQYLQQAFVAIEDKDFYNHMGISISRNIYAVINEIKYIFTGSFIGGEDGIRQGASTLNQQLIKNLTYDDNVGGIEGYFRKIREMYRAVIMDFTYDKQTILEGYMNSISFTNGTVGVQAESLKLFNKQVSELTLEQCASIACITKNQTGYNPVTNPEEHIARRNYVLYEMWQQNYITQEEYINASAMPIGLQEGDISIYNSQNSGRLASEIADDLTDDLVSNYGLTNIEATNLLYNCGLHIYTSISVNDVESIEGDPHSVDEFFELNKVTALHVLTDELTF